VLTDNWAPLLSIADDEELWTTLRRDDPLNASSTTYGLSMADRPDVALRRAADLVADLRAVNAITGLPYILTVSGQASWLLGQWSQAEAALDESRELGDQTGQATLVANALAFESFVAAARGEADRCHRLADHTERVLRPFEQAATAVPLFLHHARGLCSLGAGQLDEACRYLRRARAFQSALPAELPTFARFAGDLVEALCAAGQRHEAAGELAALEDMRAARWSPWIRAIVHRGHALVDDDDPVGRFEEALRAHAEWDAWEIARTRLCYGRHLRRLKHRREASEQLQAALATFERLGATGWANQAQDQLRPLGVRAGGGPRPSTGLTAQELRVALAVAAGGTNRDVAAALFMSPKTVEHHLSRAFAKVGVTSRTQLARAVESGQLDLLTC
jgi:DNA-binding CsgD family transcriptional regulator